MNSRTKRAIVFIDGSNFYHSMRKIGLLTSGANFDYEALSRKLVGTRTWVETRYYIGRVQQKGDLTRYQKQREFLAHLEQLNKIKVFLGRVEMRPAKSAGKKLQRWLNALPHREGVDLSPYLVDELNRIAHSAGSPIWIEKMVDVMIATDMVSMAFEDQYDVAYLLSADGDFTPAVQKVRDTGRQVFAASASPGYKIAQAVDTFIPMKREFFHGCWI